MPRERRDPLHSPLPIPHSQFASLGGRGACGAPGSFRSGRFLRTGLRATRAPSARFSPGRHRTVFHVPGSVPGSVRAMLQSSLPVSSRVFSHAGFTLTRPGRNAVAKAFMADGVRNSFTGAMPSPDRSSTRQSFTLEHAASEFGLALANCLQRKRCVEHTLGARAVGYVCTKVDELERAAPPRIAASN